MTDTISAPETPGVTPKAEQGLDACKHCGDIARRHIKRGPAGFTRSRYYQEYIQCKTKRCRVRTPTFKRPNIADKIWNGSAA